MDFSVERCRGAEHSPLLSCRRRKVSVPSPDQQGLPRRELYLSPHVRDKDWHQILPWKVSKGQILAGVPGRAEWREGWRENSLHFWNLQGQKMLAFSCQLHAGTVRGTLGLGSRKNLIKAACWG